MHLGAKAAPAAAWLFGMIQRDFVNGHGGSGRARCGNLIGTADATGPALMSSLPSPGGAQTGAALQADDSAFLYEDLFRVVTRHCGPENTKVAVACGARILRYSELLGAVGALAGVLSPSRTGEDLVGICVPRSVDMVVAMLAVLRGGAAYVPLDPAFPPARLEYMVRHSGLSRVVTTEALRPLFDGTGIEVVELQSAKGRDPAPVPPIAAHGSAPAYVIYTSGSTGTPKGVAVPRRALTNLLLSMLRRPGIGPGDTWCAVTTLSFDIAALELLAPLAAGGTVVIATEDEARDPRMLLSLLAASRATVLQATPITWRLLCAAGWSGDPALTALCGGEALLPALARDLAPRVGALWNMYGPTETTVWSTCQRIEDATAPVAVGTPIANTSVYVVDDHLQLVPPGTEGRLFIGGEGIALGYVHDDAQTAARFVPDRFRGKGRMYDTGDLARLDAAGTLYLVGRADHQVKLRGFRIELGEVEARLSSATGVELVACTVRSEDPRGQELVAYYTLRAGFPEPSVAALRAHCSAVLPAHMVPSRFQLLASMPRTPNGKVDRSALPAPAEPAAGRSPSPPRSDLERALLRIWCSVLEVPSVGIHDGFFDLGGTSLGAVTVAAEIRRALGVEASVLQIFEHPTIAGLAAALQGTREYAAQLREASEHARARRRDATSATAFDVAIVGAAGRFPGAKNLDDLWKNLCEGRDTVTFFRPDEIDPLVPRSTRDDPSYVRARGVLDDVDKFDAAFFDVSPGEAELMAPQLRVFLEIAWEAFENAGYVGETIRGPVGVWAGMGNNFYYVYNVLTRPDKLALMGEIAAEIANEKDHVAPRVSHKLNLRGPSLSVHAACATGLVAVESAYQALVTHQVDAALAGAVDIRTPQKSGQLHDEGGIFSVDGRCRPFDAQATGTMFGEGVGAVVLKRFDDAVRDGDTIYAVIKGAAVNHDGGRKGSYLSPSVDGQARVIASALALADVHPETITYVEAHGTATPIGDPIEVEALSRVYRTFTQRRGYCAIGSIKGNFGHATTAAGIAGLLKAMLALRHRKIPPTVHFEKPNPRIDFDRSPFFVNSELLDWTPPGIPRRAAVSSFGFCGTNAHVVLEEAPAERAPAPTTRRAQLVLVSARSRPALDASARQLAEALRGADASELADLVYTTHVGRKRHEHRRCAVVFHGDEAGATLSQASGPRSASLEADAEDPPVAFVFPGQGAQYTAMGQSLYEGEPRVRETIDRCAAVLAPELGLDLRELLFCGPGDAARAREALDNTRYTQPAIFVVSYALASLFRHWGIKPSAFVGHSIGEFVAATLGGVMQLEDALRLVATRGRLMEALPRGSMLTVRMAPAPLVERLPPGVDLAALNGPQLCTVAGPTPLIASLSERLAAEGVVCRMLHTSHAFHSSMMDPVVEPFLRVVETVSLSSPRVPFVSTVTGDWIDASLATDPSYWARHLRAPVQFSRAIVRLLEDPSRVVLDCGPGRSSAVLAQQHRPSLPARVIAAMPDSGKTHEEYPSVLLALGALWQNGCSVDWRAFHEGETRQRRALPTYPFQRKRYWIEPGNTLSFGLEGAPARGNGAAATPANAPWDVDRTNDEGANRRSAPARDEATSVVVGLIEDLLGHELEELDPDLSFTALGLDSLLLTQLSRALRVRLGLEISFRQLTEQLSTVRRLADAARTKCPPGVGNAAGHAAPQASSPTAAVELTTTPEQLEMWLTRLAGPEAACACNESFTVRLSGAIDDDALVRALQALPEAHEALRGHYAKIGRRFVLQPRVDVTTGRHDFSRLDPGARAEALRRLEEEDARTPYDTERGPLFRAAVVDLGPHERAVLLGAHHSVCDGWSLDVVLTDLGRFYSAFAGHASVPAPPRHGFSDYVALRTQADYASKIAASRAFWRKALELPPPPLDLPFDGRRPPLRSYRAHHALCAPGSSLVSTIRAFARSEGLSFFAVLLSGYAALLNRLSGAPDFVVGVPIAGHPEAGMDECVGHLVNMVPLRFRVAPDQSFLDLCRATAASLLDAREHAAVSFGEIIADVIDVRHDPARVPLIAAVMTHLQKMGPEKLAFAGCSVDYRLSPRAFENFELNLSATESRDGLELTIHGNADLVSRKWLELRLRELESLLEVAVGAPHTTIANLRVAAEHENDALRRGAA
jgi:amino acid adenylation domain-containing protein